MEVRCALCGKKEIITEVHKDFERLTKKPKTIYICEQCNAKLQYEAVEYNKPRKPI